MTGKSEAIYSNGYHSSVLKAHGWRTAENSCPHLLPKLVQLVKENPQLLLLDVGCGSGSITTTLAAYLPKGTAIGLDVSDEPLEFARANAAAKGCNNTTFQAGSIYELPFPNNHFDVVHISQVLIHVPDRVGAVKELLRVCKSGGTVAMREGLTHTSTLYPEAAWFTKHSQLVDEQLISAGADVMAGKKLRAFALEAGVRVEDMESSAGAYTWAEREERLQHAEVMAGRVLESSYAGFAEQRGVGRQELEAIAQGWKDWSQHPAGWLSILNGQILITKR